MREQNGWIDDGSPLRGGAKECPNCGSSNYIETLSREKCHDCGLECDYWGGGSNEVYDEMMQRIWDERRALEEAEFKRIYGDDD